MADRSTQIQIRLQLRERFQYRLAMNSSTRPYLWMLTGSFSFTLMAEFAHVLTHQGDWRIVATTRAGLVALFAISFVFLGGARFAILRPWRLWVRSVAGSFSMLCTFYAFAKLRAADVLTLTNTFPIWVALLSWPVLGRAPGSKMLVAILVGIIGVWLVEQPNLEKGNPGVYSALAAASLTAIAMLGLHSLKGIDPRAIVAHFSVVATIFCGSAYLLHEFILSDKQSGATAIEIPLQGFAFSTEVILKFIGMGISATIGQLCLTMAFSGGAPAKVSVVGLSQIVMGLLFDTILWHDTQINRTTIVGTLLIIAPTAWLLSRPVSAQSESLEDFDVEAAIGIGDTGVNQPLIKEAPVASPSSSLS